MENAHPSKAELKEMAKHLFHGVPSAGPLLVEGKGCKAKDIDGKEYIDCGSQGFVLNTGYSNEEVIEAAFQQARKLAHVRVAHDTITRFMLARKLAELAPGGLNRVTFVIGGGSAIETGLKIAILNRPGAQNFISLYNAWHGCSFTTWSAGWVTTMTHGEFVYGTKYFPFVGSGFIRVPNPYCYRCYFTQEYPNCHLLCAKSIRHTIEKGAPGPVAGILLEPFQGNGGDVSPPPGYLEEVRETCDEFGIPLIYDEVQTAFGRLGTMFGAEYYKVYPDIMCTSKALANGFAIGAVIVDDRLGVFEPTGADVHTFGNSLIAQAAALANLEYIVRENLPERARQMGEYATARLKQLQKQYPQIGDVRGPGLHIGVEFVKDPETKEPAFEEARRFYNEALRRGVILGTGTGVRNLVKIKPPLIITRDEMDEVLNVFEDVLKVVF